MFSTLKLFAQVPCPDRECPRVPCLFSHDPRILATRPSTAPAQTSTAQFKVAREPTRSVVGVKRKVDEAEDHPVRNKPNAHGILASSGGRPSAVIASTARPATIGVKTQSASKVRNFPLVPNLSLLHCFLRSLKPPLSQQLQSNANRLCSW
jgi:hypothetical protein